MRGYLQIIGSNQGIMLIAGAILLFVLSAPLMHFVGALLFFTAFDVFGFTFVDQRRGTKEYRVIQNAFFGLLIMYLLQINSWPVAAAFFVAWYFLFCDVLFYAALDIPLNDFSWFTISPVNFFFNKILKRPTPAYLVTISGVIGLAMGIYLIRKYYV